MTDTPSTDTLKFVHETMETMEEGLTIGDKFRWASAIDALIEQRAAETRRVAIEECAQEADNYYCPIGSCGEDIATRIRALADQVKP